MIFQTLTKWRFRIARSLKICSSLVKCSDHKFENCPLYPKSFSVKIEKRLIDSSIAKEPSLENKQSNLMANENWVEIKPKSRQGPNMGEPLQRNPKNSGTIEKEAKGKDQGLLKEEILVKPPDAPEAIKGHKEPEHSRSDKHPAPSGTNIGQHQLSMGLQPPLHNIIWQVRMLFHFWIYPLIHLFQNLIGTLFVPYFLSEKLFMVYYISRLTFCRTPGFGYYITIFLWHVKLLTPFDLSFQPFQLDDSKFKVLAMRMTSLWMTRLIVYLWS